MNRRFYNRFKPYGVSVLATTIALLITLCQKNLFAPTPALLFFMAIILSNWYGGLKPGLLAAVLSTLAINYFFIPPLFVLTLASPSEAVRLGIFILVAFIVNRASSDLRRSKRQVKQLDRELLEVTQKSAEQLKLALTAARMGMWNWNLLTGEINWSPEHEQLFGLARGTFDGRYETFDERLHPDDREALTIAVNRAIQERRIYQHEYRVVWTDGSIHWIEGRGQAFYDETGQAVQMTGTIMDISDAVAAATQRKLAQAALQEREAILRLFAQYAPAGIAMFDRDMRYVMASQRWVDEYHLDSIESLMNRSHYEIFPEISERWRQIHQRCLAGAIEKCDDDLFVRANGMQQWISWEIHPWYTATDEIGGIIIFSVDVTKRKQAEIALVQLNAELEQRVQERTAQLSQTNELLQREQEALQQSESTLRSFFDSASMMMGIVELMDDDILHISDNATTAKLFGLTPETMHNRRASEMGVPQELLRMWIEHYREAERTQSPVRFKYTHETDQGQRWLSATVCSIAPNLSKRQRFAYVVEDITERKQTEQERDNLINIIEASPDFIGMGFDMRANYLNRAAREWMGLSKDDDLANFSISDSHPNWAFEIVRDQAIPAAIQDGLWLGETAFLKHDGREIPTSQLLIAHKGADGSVKMFSTIARDITQQKQVEATLREAERRWRYLLENVRLVVVGLDITGKVEFVNAFFLELTGYTQAEAIGKDWFETFLPLQEQQQVYTAFQEVLEYDFHPHYTNAILTKSGEERIIAWNNTLLQNLQGEVIGTMSIGEDITERHAVEKMKNEFISIVSHELRTPLTSIRGSLGILATGALNNHPQRMQRMIEIAAIDTERLVRLVNDILDLERLDSGRVTLVKECCNAVALMVQAAEGMRSLAEKENITLSVSPIPSLVWASPDHIIQTLTNLLSNAIKFSPANSTITLIAEPLGDRVLFQVKDQGRGIPADKLDTIFGRFQQVDASDSRSKGGTGLGLAICQSIITQHGGRIWVDSVLSEGSTFYFTLPVPPEQA
jgi:PAS domain S-box-containing protein